MKYAYMKLPEITPGLKNKKGMLALCPEHLERTDGHCHGSPVHISLSQALTPNPRAQWLHLFLTAPTYINWNIQ